MEVEVEGFHLCLLGMFPEQVWRIGCVFVGDRNGRDGAGGFISFLASRCLTIIVVVKLCVDFGFVT